MRIIRNIYEGLQDPQNVILIDIVYPDDMQELKKLAKLNKSEGENYLCLVSAEILVDLMEQSEFLEVIQKGRRGG